MVGGIFYEHGHRMIASFVGLLTIVLAVWLWRAESRRWVRNVGFAALGVVVAQGLLGGLTVLLLLPTAISVGHACLAQLFFTMTVSLAFVTSPSWPGQATGGGEGSSEKDSARPPLSQLCLATNVAIFLQLLLGAAFRHQGMGILPHLTGAVVVAILVVWLLVRATTYWPNRPSIQRWALALNGLVMLQLVLGAGAYWIRVITQDAPQPMLAMVALTVAHVALGALVLATSVLLTIQVHYSLRAQCADIQHQTIPAAI